MPPPEAGKRVWARIKAVLDGCIAKGERDTTRGNPANARLIAAIVPSKRRGGDRRHFRRIEIDDAPAALQKPRAEPEAKGGTALDAWLFMIATCAPRPSEALHTRWDEIDLDKKLWVLPPSKTKNAKTHVAPLPSVALEVLEQRREVRTGDLVFAGRGALAVGYSNFFRAPERGGGYSLRKLAFVEVDLGEIGPGRHRSRRSRPCRGGARPQSRQEASYRRETAVEARRPVMDAYAGWLCGDAGADVIAFPSRA